MAFKIIICIAAIVLKAVVVSTYVAVPDHARVIVPEDFDPNPQYTYGYDIQDDYTGDSKSHKEIRQGDFVQGSYSLVDSDGHKRTVEYTADSVHGFNAVVHREPINVNGVNDVAISGKTAQAASAYSAYPDYDH